MLQFQTNNDDDPKFQQRSFQEIIDGAKGWKPKLWPIIPAAIHITCAHMPGDWWYNAINELCGIAWLGVFFYGWLNYHKWLTTQVYDEHRWRMDWADIERHMRSTRKTDLAEKYLEKIEDMREINDNNWNP